MPSTITITLDAQGNATISELPPGVFCSRFATPPDATDPGRDLGQRRRHLYRFVINAPSVGERLRRRRR